MKILLRALHFHVEIANAPQTVRDARLLLAQPVIVGDAHIIGALQKRILACDQQLVKTLAAALLHALQHELDVHRQIDFQRLERLDGMDPAQHGALVVRGAAAVQLAVLLGQHERLGVPAVLNQRRLDVQMTVNANGGLGGILHR